MPEKRPLFIIAGPTASGKTAISLDLAEKIGGEIISCDSMQVYRMMDIGSAKITKEEMRKVPHHLIDVLDPKEPFNVYIFLKLAREAADGIYSRGHIPILVGGTGFYIQAFLYDIDFKENSGDLSYRKMLEKEAAEGKKEELFQLLEKIDPESALTIDKNNVKRVIRALEYFHETQQKISEHNKEERQKESPFDFRYFVLNRDRKELYEHIEQRVDHMMEAGLLEEVKKLKDYGVTRDMTSMQGLGYRQLFQYLEGECTLEEAVQKIKTETRHFAKRQITWFKRERDVIWADASREDLLRVLIDGYQ